MNRKRVPAAVIVVVALVIPVIVVTNGDDHGHVQPTTSLTLSEADLASKQAAFEAEVTMAQGAAERTVAHIESRVKQEASPDGQLSIIVTAYCRLPSPRERDMEESNVSRLLVRLYEKYWQAGGKWNRPLGSAARQQGGCPDLPYTPEPVPWG